MLLSVHEHPLSCSVAQGRHTVCPQAAARLTEWHWPIPGHLTDVLWALSELDLILSSPLPFLMELCTVPEHAPPCTGCRDAPVYLMGQHGCGQVFSDFSE